MTKANMSLMKQLVMNGPDKHPGANFLQQRDQNFKKLAFCILKTDALCRHVQVSEVW